jgi:phosphatidylglycerophosphatase A
MQPAQRSLAAKLLLIIGSLGPLGHAPASGTVAVAVAGIPLAWWMTTYLTLPLYLLVTTAFIIAAILIHHAGDRILGESDSRRLVWDELAGFLVAFIMVPWSWKIAAVAFVLERAIDIAKVPPADVIDRKMHNGVGVVLDDVVAGIYTCGILHLLVHLFPTWLL